MFCFKMYKMNQIANNFLLLGDKFMPEMHLRQPGFTYSVSGLLKTNEERIEKILFIKMSLIKLDFNIIWLMVNRKIYQKELSQTKF